MSQNDSKVSVIYPSNDYKKKSHLSSLEEYKTLYKKSVEKPKQFWTEVAEHFHWKKLTKDVLSYNFDINQGTISIKWMNGALTNMCYNVLDRIIDKGMGNRIAYYWYVITYKL